MTVVEFEGFVALFADMFDFVFAAEDGVHETDVVVKTVAVSTFSALFLFTVRKFDTVLYCFFTFSIGKRKV